MATAIDKPAASGPASNEGKKIFSPNDLNQAGEDKEYFHPDKGHKYEVPKDATDHALTPDIEVTPGNKIRPVTK